MSQNISRIQRILTNIAIVIIFSVALNFTNIPELVVEYDDVASIKPGKRLKIAIDFRPKQVKEYVFTLQFFVNSLCEEIVTIRGEGLFHFTCIVHVCTEEAK